MEITSYRQTKWHKDFMEHCMPYICNCLLVLCVYFVFQYIFNGMSYVIQFVIFTLLFAVPRFSIQSYIYVIFITSLVFHIFRYIYQFTKLYKTLLETILKLQGENSIAIQHFDLIVMKHFPVSNESFYLFLKVMLSSLFFVIIYDTMQKVGYIRFGAQPDLTTVITFFFFFGPPRLIEGLFMTDFTSRVYMKEEEIKEDIEKLANNVSESRDVKPSEDIKICKGWKTDGPVCNKMRYVCTFCFGCFQCPVDDEGFCECCYFLTLNSDRLTNTIVKIPTICLYKKSIFENKEDLDPCEPPTIAGIPPSGGSGSQDVDSSDERTMDTQL